MFQCSLAVVLMLSRLELVLLQQCMTNRLWLNTMTNSLHGQACTCSTPGDRRFVLQIVIVISAMARVKTWGSASGPTDDALVELKACSSFAKHGGYLQFRLLNDECTTPHPLNQ
jgi:hypothetical protein